MIDLCTLSGVLFWPLFCVHFWVLSDKSTFLSTSLITFLSSLGLEHFFECFIEHSFEYFFEYSRARVHFWALSWALFWVLSGESTFLSTFLSTQKSTLGISAPTSKIQLATSSRPNSMAMISTLVDPQANTSSEKTQSIKKSWIFFGRMSFCYVLFQDCSAAENIFVIFNNVSNIYGVSKHSWT